MSRRLLLLVPLALLAATCTSARSSRPSVEPPPQVFGGAPDVPDLVLDAPGAPPVVAPSPTIAEGAETASAAPGPATSFPDSSLSDLAPGAASLVPVGRIADDRIDENSDLVHLDGWYYTINDSGGAASVYASESLSFENAIELPVPEAVNVDWEALTVLDGDLVVCDVGDNRRERDDLMLYRVRLNEAGQLDLIAKYPVAYPDGAHDVEAAFVYERYLHLIVKNRGEAESTVFRFETLVDEVDLPSGETNMGTRVGAIVLPRGEQATSATLHPEGLLVVLTYSQVLFWPAEAPDGEPLGGFAHHSRQSEAVCMVGEDLLWTNEQRDVYRVPEVLSVEHYWWLPPRKAAWLKEVPLTKEALQASMPPMELLGELDMENMRPGEFLRFGLSADQLFFDGRMLIEGDFVPTEAGKRTGTALIVVFGTDQSLRIDGRHSQFAFVGTKNGTVRVRRIDLSGGEPEGGLAGIQYSGNVSEEAMRFSVAIDSDVVFPDGVPDQFLMNVVGNGFRVGLDEPIYSGFDFFSVLRPYVWAGVHRKP